MPEVRLAEVEVHLAFLNTFYLTNFQKQVSQATVSVNPTVGDYVACWNMIVQEHS